MNAVRSTNISVALMNAPQDRFPVTKEVNDYFPVTKRVNDGFPVVKEVIDSNHCTTSRPCPHCRTMKKARRVHFAEDVQVHIIKNFRDFPLWFHDNQTGVSVVADWEMARAQRSVWDYLCAYEWAYHLLRQGADIDQLYQRILIHGSTLGFRTMERFAEASVRREQMNQWNRSAIVTTFKMLVRNDTHWATKLGLYCQERSRASQLQAAFMGHIDAAAARVEYATLPHELRPEHRSLLSTPMLYRQPPVQHETAMQCRARGKKRLEKHHRSMVVLW
jgi:hypothetical protein